MLCGARALARQFATSAPPPPPSPPSSQSLTAIETSIQTPSTGHSESGATFRAPRYTQKEMQRFAAQTRTQAKLPSIDLAQKLDHAILPGIAKMQDTRP